MLSMGMQDVMKCQHKTAMLLTANIPHMMNKHYDNVTCTCQSPLYSFDIRRAAVAMTTITMVAMATSVSSTIAALSDALCL